MIVLQCINKGHKNDCKVQNSCLKHHNNRTVKIQGNAK
nr:MAG TPA: hypothetical protein [Caudoviricetes sp.]